MEKCASCKFGRKEKGVLVTCKRYPTAAPMYKSADDWCGEYKSESIVMKVQNILKITGKSNGNS